jgi:hypothetical protein
MAGLIPLVLQTLFGRSREDLENIVEVSSDVTCGEVGGVMADLLTLVAALTIAGAIMLIILFSILIALVCTGCWGWRRGIVAAAAAAAAANVAAPAAAGEGRLAHRQQF